MNHIHLGTRNMATIRKFYETYFGFEKLFDHGPDGIFLSDSKGFLLAIDVVKEVPELPDWYHVGFCQSDEAAVFKLYDAMKTNGENIVRDMKTEKGSYASYFVKDPDGNRIEVSWHNG